MAAVSNKKKVIESNNTLEKIDCFFKRYEKLFLWISLALGAIISFLMFDCKVSLSGDDCDYVINAENFFKHFTYPGGRGALYPIVIAPFMIGGLHLILLKSLSAVFIILSMWFTYKAFKDKIPTAVLMPALLIVNICPYIFFYASYTYSEPFFMLVQALFIYYFSKNFCDEEQKIYEIKTDWPKFMIMALYFLAMGLTRTIGYAVLGGIIIYFCFQKQWRHLLYSFLSCGAVFIIFSIIKKIVWPESGAAYNINNYLAKNFYNIEQGFEDFPGYIHRIVVNSQVYLSGFMYKFMGLRSSSNFPLEHKPILAIITYIIFFICLIAIFKRNKPLLLTGLYVGIMNFASFVLLQTNWEQDRLIMIYYPLILIFLFGGLYYLLRKLKSNISSILYIAVISIIFLCTSFHLKEKLKQTIPVLQENILGNDLYGLTPDWENFVKMCRWANDNLPQDAVIASRKPSISYIYTGREFQGIFNVPNAPLNDIINDYNKDKGEYEYFIVEIENSYMANIAPFTKYVLVSKPQGDFHLNDKKINSTIIYKVPKEISESIETMLEKGQKNYTKDFESYIRQYIDSDGINYLSIEPDMLLNELKNNKVRYLLLPKIRLYTPENTGQYVNTIHQYINFINLKYPNKFRIINSIGKEETCELAEFTDN